MAELFQEEDVPKIISVMPGSLLLYLRAVQGNSGESQIDPVLRDNVLLPSDFAENISHVGEASKKNTPSSSLD